MQKPPWETAVLKGLLGFYILFCLLIAGLNYGYAPGASEPMKKIISTSWHIYENELKTLLILVCAFLTLRLEKKKQRVGMRRRNLLGFIFAALAIHIAGPRLLGNPELYFFAMPIPWTTTAFQLMDPSSPFSAARAPEWGPAGVGAVLIFFLIINLVVFIGTFFLGRRWQCSTLCLFNGFAAEIWAPAFPLLGKKGKPGQYSRRFLTALRWVLLTAALFYTALWILRLSGISFSENLHSLLIEIEVWKYLLLELMMALFFWTVLSGRGYCYSCPLGTVLAALSRTAGQKITTHSTQCIECGKCNLACPMSIDIRQKARVGLPVIHNLCVGCGHCVDICPTETLRYATRWYSIGGIAQRKG